MRARCAGLVAGLLAPWAAMAGIVPLTQDRFVTIFAQADAPGVPGIAESLDWGQSQQAGGWSFHNQVVAEQPPAVAITRVEHSSIVEPAYVGGRSSIELFAGPSMQGGKTVSLARSVFEAAFRVIEPMEVVFAGQVTWGGRSRVTLDGAWGTIVRIDGMNAEVGWRGVLAPGMYRASAGFDSLVESLGGGPEQILIDSWSFSMQPVPGLGATAVMGWIGAVALTRRRR